jgi:hypothetical protein
MKNKAITIWQYKEEQIVMFSKNGNSRTFATAHDLVQFLQDKTGKTTFTITVEQA